MPFLLLCGMGFSAFMAGIGLLVLILMVPMLVFGSSFTFNGEAVSRAEFLARSWPLLLFWPLLMGLVGAIAYGLLRERSWSRSCILAFWGISAIAQVPLAFQADSSGMELVSALLAFAILGGCAVWYLYGKTNVIAYYHAIGQRAIAREDPNAELVGSGA